MTFQITLKDPDRVSDFINEVAEQTRPEDLDDDEWEWNKKQHRESVAEKFSKWIKWKEYIRIDFDLDKGTATVVPSNE